MSGIVFGGGGVPPDPGTVTSTVPLIATAPTDVLWSIVSTVVTVSVPLLPRDASDAAAAALAWRPHVVGVGAHGVLLGARSAVVVDRSVVAVTVGLPLSNASAIGSSVIAAAVSMYERSVVQDGAAFSLGRRDGARLTAAGELRGPGSFESSVVASPFPFTHVGLPWAGGDTAPSAAFEVRTSGDATSWSPWEATSVEAGPSETPRGETFAALHGAARHRYVQYRVDLAEPVSIRSVTATLINSVDGPVIETPGAVAVSTAAKPVDFTRGQWGADESLRFHNGVEIWPREYVPVKKLIVHHTVTPNSYSNAAAEVRAIYAYHASSLGWGDIGYNALVDKFGKSYEGRYGRVYGNGAREVLSQDVVGGHALNHNYGSFGVAVIGDFEAAPPPADLRMLARLVEVLEWAAEARWINPHGVSDFLLTDGTWNRGLLNLCGHRDCGQTACPGQHMYDALPAIRDLVAARIDGGPAQVELIAGPDGRSWPDPKLSYSWRDPTGRAVWYSYYLEGWAFGPNGAVEYRTGFDSSQSPVWSGWHEATTAAFLLPADGRYTFHVRSRDANGRVAKHEANRTVLANVEEDDVAAIEDLQRRNSVASLFFHASSYSMRGEPLPNALRDQILYLLALIGTGAGGGAGTAPSPDERDYAASVFLQAAGHALAGEPLP
ncbi:MAG: N-acetylmuramoyl-L-alanine amidase, partial [Dehalococcoidia bacterium]|nr:N-acetylmuramoyl-L-alanine amidase [Dehalococcoidia bacterium]